MTARENDFESQLRYAGSEAQNEEIASIPVAIAMLQVQAERAAGNIELVKTKQLSQEMMLNILTQDMREVGNEIGQMHAQVDETRMEMGEMSADTGAIRAEAGDMRARLDAVERNIDARFDAMELKFDAVLAALHAIAPHAPPAPRAAAGRSTGRRSRARCSPAPVSTPRRPRNVDAA